jgi:hypothetical protein
MSRRLENVAPPPPVPKEGGSVVDYDFELGFCSLFASVFLSLLLPGTTRTNVLAQDTLVIDVQQRMSLCGVDYGVPPMKIKQHTITKLESPGQEDPVANVIVNVLLGLCVFANALTEFAMDSIPGAADLLEKPAAYWWEMVCELFAIGVIPSVGRTDSFFCWKPIIVIELILITTERTVFVVTWRASGLADFFV